MMRSLVALSLTFASMCACARDSPVDLAVAGCSAARISKAFAVGVVPQGYVSGEDVIFVETGASAKADPDLMFIEERTGSKWRPKYFALRRGHKTLRPVNKLMRGPGSMPAGPPEGQPLKFPAPPASTVTRFRLCVPEAAPGAEGRARAVALSEFTVVPQAMACKAGYTKYCSPTEPSEVGVPTTARP